MGMRPSRLAKYGLKTLKIFMYCGFIKFRGHWISWCTINGCFEGIWVRGFWILEKKDLIFGNSWAFDFVVRPNHEIHVVVRPNHEIHEIKCPTNINETTVFRFDHPCCIVLHLAKLLFCHCLMRSCLNRGSGQFVSLPIIWMFK